MFQYSCHTHIEIEIAYKGACTGKQHRALHNKSESTEV